MKIHHIGIIEKNIEQSIQIYSNFDFFPCTDLVIDVIQNNKIIFLKNRRNQFLIELIEPIDDTSSIYRYPKGYHHICFDVSEYSDFCSFFANLNCGKIFTKPIVAPAINDRLVVFAYLKNMNLVEFIL